MKFNGWKQVFKFTYFQMIKSKAYIVSTVVIAVCLTLMAVGLNFLPGMLSGSLGELFGSSDGEINIKTLYISDRSGIEPALDFGFLSEQGIKIIPITESEIEQVTTEVNTSLEPVALVEIKKSDYGYNILASRPEHEAQITADDCHSVLNLMSGVVWASHLISIGVPENSLGEVGVSINSQVTIAGEALRNEFAVMIMNTALPMLSALILFMFIILYGQLTAQSIAMEKTSRVMETLLTSVRPLAIILGKVLGMGLASLTQFFVLAAGGAIVSVIVAPFGMLGQVFGMVEISIDDANMQMIHGAFDEAFSGFNAMSLVWIVIVFILGFIFYSLIAGLFGATVSRSEDLQAAMQPMALIGVLGFYMAYIAPAFSIESDNVNIIQRISYYLPISSPFALPAVIISGEMSMGGIIVSLFVLAVFCLLMLMFVSRVYEAIIMHTGSRIKIGTLFKLAKKK
ncbi:MAG: ABC transporter permease [Oscillospiraceae bacterium]|nr:ABC transporter permease [Oscillospiraceae bacterium]